MFQILSIIFFLVMLSLASTLHVRVTCEACTITCGSQNCFRIRGDGLDQQQCSNIDSCDTSLDYTVQINRCDSNFYGSDCERGYCYYPKQISACASSLLGQDTCNDPFWFFAGCQECQETECTQCRRIQTSFTNGSSQTCIGRTCNGLGNINLTVSSCENSQDSFGNECNCCFNIDGSNNGNLGLCTEDFSIFETSEFNSWVRNSIGLGEMSILYGSMIIAGFIMLLN